MMFEVSFNTTNVIKLHMEFDFKIWTLWRDTGVLIIHWLNPKARVNVKNGQLKAIKATLRLSRYPIHPLMFEVGFYFRSFTSTKPIVKEAPIYLGHQCPAITFIYSIKLCDWVPTEWNSIHLHVVFIHLLLTTTLWCLVSRTLFAKGLSSIPRGLQVSRLLIVNTIILVNISEFS